MTTKARAALVFTVWSIAACSAEDALHEVDSCSWTREHALARDRWTYIGPRVADDGNATVVAWEEAPQETTLGGWSIGTAQAVYAVFDSATGATRLEPTALAGTDNTDDVRVVATGAGFLLFALHGEGMNVYAIDDAGAVIGGPTQFDQAVFADGLVADADGATFATDNPAIEDTSHIVRIDAAAEIVAEAALPGDLALCAGAAPIPSSTRLAFWCYDTANNDAPALVTAERDGRDIEVHGLPADILGTTARLVQSGDALLAVYAWQDEVRAVRLAEDGSILLGPSRIGAGDDNLDLVGGNVCLESCRGVTTATTTRGVLVGYQQFPTSFQSPERERATFSLLSVDADGFVSTDVDTQVAYAHDVASDTSSLTLAWLERLGSSFLWTNPPQRIVVQHRCDATP